MGLIVSASDIQAEQARTLASAQTTDTTVQACTTIDATSKSEWETFYASLTAWCQRPVCNFYWYPGIPSNCIIATADAGDTMLAFENQLQAWRRKISGLCAGSAPGLTTFNPNPAGAQATEWLRYLAIIAGFVGTAYAVAEVAGVVGLFAAARPRPLPRASESKKLKRR